MGKSEKTGWIPYSQVFEFSIGALCLCKTSVRGVILDKSFLHLSTALQDTLPPWQEFSPDIRVAVVPGQPIEEDLPRTVLLPEAIRYVTTNENRYFIELQGSFSNYLKKFSSKSRSTWARKVRKWAAFSGGQVSWKEFCSPVDMREFLRFARQISAKTYQHSIGRGLVDAETFHLKIMGLAENDAVRGYILFHIDQPVAYVYCPAQQDVLIYEHLGYDPAFRNWSPGVVLLYVMLEHLFAVGRFRFLDFGAAEYEYKQFFSTESIRCARLHYFRRTVRNQCLVAVHAFMISFSYGVGRALEKLSIKEKLKRFTRVLEIRKRSLQRAWPRRKGHHKEESTMALEMIDAEKGKSDMS